MLVQRRGDRHALAALVVAVLASLAVASAARGDVGDRYLDRCLNAGTAQAPCSSAGGLTGAFPQVLSPDGKQLYVGVAGGTPPGGSAEDPAILIYDRASDGALTRRAANGCVTKTGSSGACTAAARLDNPQDLVVSPDGKSLYVTAAGTQTILEFDRASDGSLSLKSECQSTGTPCETATGMGGPQGLALSPDGATLYARTSAGQGYGTLLVFDRAADGTLQQKAAPNGCWSETAQTNCTTGAGIAGNGWQLAVAPDGKNVYATGQDDYYNWYTSGCGAICVYSVPSSGTIATFGRAPDGTLSQAPGLSGGCISNNGQSGGIPFSGPAPVRCANGDDALDEARSVTTSPDGKFVYVGASYGMVVYQRNAGTGALTSTECLAGAGYAGCAHPNAIGGTFRMAHAPDGSELIAGSTSSNGYAFFTRGSDGRLTQRAGKKGCITQDGTGGACETLAALGGYGAPVVSPDSLYAYLTGSQNGALVTMHRDVAPVCDDTSLSTPFDQSAVAGLPCHDVNGDALTIAITRQPAGGFLTAVDQGARSVRYIPASGYSGADSFAYTATGNGVTSGAGTASVSVGAKPAPSAPPAASPAPVVVKPTPVVASGVTASWRATRRFTTVRALKVTRAAAGTTITVTCKGRGCRFKTKRITVKKAAKAVDLTKLFNARSRKAKLAPGAKVTIRIAHAGATGKTVTYTIRAAGKPRAVTRTA